jgi:DNA-3-methyladenine glycosylase II
VILDLNPQPPFDFARTAACSRLYATMQVYRDRALYRLFRVGDGLALVRVTDVGGNPAPLHLRAECVATQGEVDEARLAEEVRYWMALDRSFADFYGVVDEDPALRLIVYSLYGLHMLRTPSVFEALMVTMIEQQIALSAAQKAERWLIETYGDYLEYEGVRYSAFPTPETIALLDETALTPLKITFVRVRRMLAIACAVVDGSLDLEALRHKSQDEAYVALMALNGVGHWTAAWTMIRALGTYLYVGNADVALRAAVNQYWYGQPGRASREQTDAHFGQYGDFAGEACVYTLMHLGLERYPQKP